MGIIEPVATSDEASYFLPHHAVVRQDKETSKVRVVFDGSARPSKDDLSLNECLEKGPNLVPNLFDTIVKFRGYPVGLVADVEKAFHQILIALDDRKMLRFLWFDDVFKDNPTIKQYQFRRLPFGLTPSPAILSTIIHHHLSPRDQKDGEVASLLKESLYVGDFAGGAYNDDEAVEVYQTSQHIMDTGGFRLQKWHSNSPYVRDIIANDLDVGLNAQNTDVTNKAVPKDSGAPDSKAGLPASNVPRFGQDCFVKILGLNWNVQTDEFYYDLQEMIEYAESLPPTKRSVLKFAKEFRALNQVHVPRCYFQVCENLSRTHQLHGFSDASDKALAAVVYLRTVHDNGDVDVSLVASKTRVAPIKSQTTPRLELMGALLLTRLIKSIVCALRSLKVLSKVILWTDSFTTLCWIKNNRAWKPFIQSRVKEIRELTSEYEWRHCPGECNPADLPSRGCTGGELAECDRWWKGPLFLSNPPENWPVDPQPTRNDQAQASLELLKNPPLVTHSLSGPARSTNSLTNIEKIIDMEDIVQRSNCFELQQEFYVS